MSAGDLSGLASCGARGSRHCRWGVESQSAGGACCLGENAAGGRGGHDE